MAHPNETGANMKKHTRKQSKSTKRDTVIRPPAFGELDLGLPHESGSRPAVGLSKPNESPYLYVDGNPSRRLHGFDGFVELGTRLEEDLNRVRKSVMELWLAGNDHDHDTLTQVLATLVEQLGRADDGAADVRVLAEDFQKFEASQTARVAS